MPLDAEIFVTSYLESIGADHRAELFDDEVEFNNLVRAAMRHFADVAINTFDTKPDDVYSSARIIEILQKLKEEIK